MGEMLTVLAVRLFDGIEKRIIDKPVCTYAIASTDLYYLNGFEKTTI